MMTGNIFRQAKELIETKNCGELNDEEIQIINTALLGATCLLPRVEPKYDDMPISHGLDALAKMVEEAKAN